MLAACLPAITIAVPATTERLIIGCGRLGASRTACVRSLLRLQLRFLGHPPSSTAAVRILRAVPAKAGRRILVMFGRGSGHAADSGKAGPRREACSTQARQLIAKQACSVHSAGNLRASERLLCRLCSPQRRPRPKKRTVRYRAASSTHPPWSDLLGAYQPRPVGPRRLQGWAAAPTPRPAER